MIKLPGFTAEAALIRKRVRSTSRSYFGTAPMPDVHNAVVPARKKPTLCRQILSWCIHSGYAHSGACDLYVEILLGRRCDHPTTFRQNLDARESVDR